MTNRKAGATRPAATRSTHDMTYRGSGCPELRDVQPIPISHLPFGNQMWQ